MENQESICFLAKIKPIEPRTMQYRFAKILKNVKVPSVHFHALRHMFASNCVKLGFDIKSLSEILGHSSVEITLNRYVHSSFEQKASYMMPIKIGWIKKICILKINKPWCLYFSQKTGFYEM